jgi:hypothetical protein
MAADDFDDRQARYAERLSVESTRDPDQRRVILDDVEVARLSYKDGPEMKELGFGWTLDVWTGARFERFDHWDLPLDGDAIEEADRHAVGWIAFALADGTAAIPGESD